MCKNECPALVLPRLRSCQVTPPETAIFMYGEFIEQKAIGFWTDLFFLPVPSHAAVHSQCKKSLRTNATEWHHLQLHTTQCNTDRTCKSHIHPLQQFQTSVHLTGNTTPKRLLQHDRFSSTPVMPHMSLLCVYV